MMYNPNSICTLVFELKEIDNVYFGLRIPDLIEN